MPNFRVFDSETKLPDDWVESPKFESHNKIVEKEGRNYRIISKYERAYYTSERVGRGLLGTAAVVLSLGIALLFKPVRNLFTREIKKIRFGTSFEGSAADIAIHELCQKKATCADLRKFTELKDEHLTALAQQCPQLKELKICSIHITNIPPEFENLEHLECWYCHNSITFPDNLPELKALFLICASTENWPSNMNKLEILHLIETPHVSLPSKDNLNNLKEFNPFNSTWIPKEQYTKLPAGCTQLEEAPSYLQENPI